MKVAVIGACGRVGFPFSLVLAEAGHEVYGIDINEELVDDLNFEVIPYIEEGAKELLKKNLDSGNIYFTTNSTYIKECDVVAVMLGTPVDSENNPRLDDLFDFVDYTLCPFMKKYALVILRSTVAPGTTEVIRDRIEAKTGWKESEDFHLVFCPERVLQGKSIEEITNLPQLIGAFSYDASNKAFHFFKTFNKQPAYYLTPREAEIAKLLTNMYRYVNFAFANEMWMIGEKHGVNINNVINRANAGYDRMNMPLPGPNVGGPCLFKDGRFLLSDVPFVDLIQTSFIINEGMPDIIWNSITKLNPNIKKVLILGASFKADNDDTRNSLSFKMKKVCKKNGAEVYMYDPNVSYYENEPTNMDSYDAAILMTPHTTFKHFPTWVLNDNCIIADVWKHWDKSKRSVSGIYRLGDQID